ncbi:MAG: EF-P lysine aminoacylase GenX [Gammaproteobacteria bacterium]|nr:EF-P lysine aminoacylase GenX [Gammaproteobacteria bacterium]
MKPDWRPGASLETLKARAELLGSIRAFFHARGVMEVDTPILSRHATVDRHIESFHVPGAGLWLHTSPEFAMKRLLAAGSGPIYQLCHVFRAEEAGRWHNPEFLMLEWYRPGWDHHRLMDEVEALMRAVGVGREAAFERLSYREAFRRHAGLDPFSAGLAELREAPVRRGCALPEGLAEPDFADRDLWLDLLMSAAVGPRLGGGTPCFLYDFPASQSALARVRLDDPPVAERFELFWNGTELANGFHELGDAAEQRRRFEADRGWRRERGRAVPPYDANLISALGAGFPDCAGVALGVDRLLMLLRGLPDLAATLAFDSARA